MICLIIKTSMAKVVKEMSNKDGTQKQSETISLFLILSCLLSCL